MYLVSTIFMFQASVENCSILLLYVLDRQNATSIPFTPYLVFLLGFFTLPKDQLFKLPK